MSTQEKAEQYLHVAKTIVSVASWITGGLCLTTALTGTSTSLLVSRLFKYEPANYFIPVSVIVPIMLGSWFYGSVLAPANAIIASGDAIAKLSSGDPASFVHSILSNFESFLGNFSTAGLTVTFVLLTAAIFSQNTALRTLLLVLASFSGVVSGLLKLALPRLFEYGETLINQGITNYRKKAGF